MDTLSRRRPVLRRPACGPRNAFSLIEVLVAASITAVLAGMILMVANDISGLWTRTSNRLSAEAQARYVLDRIAQDLAGAQYRDDGNVWLAVDVLDRTTNSGLWVAATATSNAKPTGGLSLALNATSLADARYGHAGAWLRFFTTRRGANDATGVATSVATASAPVAVGYQIVRRYTAAYTGNTNTAYLLHRSEVRPAATGSDTTARPGVLESGYTITAAAYAGSTSTTNTGAVTGDPLGVRVPGTNTGTRNLDSILAANIVDFGIRCYVRDSAQAGGLRAVFPVSSPTGALATASTATLRSSLPPTTAATTANYNLLFPDVVDVMIRVLTDEGARILSNYETNGTTLSLPAGTTAQQYWWQLATMNSRVFTRRIVLRGSPR